jgi:hypothetical protein
MTNYSLSDFEIVELLTTRFSGTLNNWWDKHLTKESKIHIESSNKIVFKFGCNKSCCENKFCNVISKEEEQKNFLLTLISKIENDELKDKYLKKLNKTMKNDFDKPVKTKIYLDETLERFSKQKSLV